MVASKRHKSITLDLQSRFLFFLSSFSDKFSVSDIKFQIFFFRYHFLSDISSISDIITNHFSDRFSFSDIKTILFSEICTLCSQASYFLLELDRYYISRWITNLTQNYVKSED